MKAMLALLGTLAAVALLQGNALAGDRAGVKKEVASETAKGAPREDASKAKVVLESRGASDRKMGNEAGRPVWENGVWVYTVRQTADGGVTGQTRAFSATGRLRPARVRVGFVQGGRIVSATASDEVGRFLVKGVPPGVYTVIAAGSEGIGVLWARVVPHNETANADADLVMTLAANADAALMPELLSGNKPPAAKPADNP